MPVRSLVACMQFMHWTKWLQQWAATHHYCMASGMCTDAAISLEETLNMDEDQPRLENSPRISFTVPAIVRAMLRGRIVLAMSRITSNVKLPLCLTKAHTTSSNSSMNDATAHNSMFSYYNFQRRTSCTVRSATNILLVKLYIQYS